MKRETLTELKLTDEQIKAVMDINGENIENAKVKAGTGLEALQQENETLKENLTSRDMDLKDLKNN
ncbi:hypothetical protein D1831_07185 [Lactiplantibacillus garii]|uniref:Uncharacterized protein n=1 Tax=Lactiplantibacillus garii TaxID=2306423 RepID=A0A3R8KEK5_9LACO|nr:hypothetical protein [Lactiplantibacillus garii]RRK10441.1 hypothetical protein D1831_07185 [Lactiplantibacillus garii]